MQVTVELKGYLDQYSPVGRATFAHDLPDGATVQTLVNRLRVPDEMATVIVINGRNADLDDPLAEGDRVTLIPPLSGGAARL
jgi:molybdopterin converting factor small subunit